jgi:hypothetical protein
MSEMAIFHQLPMTAEDNAVLIKTPLQSHNYPYNHSHGAKIDRGPYRQWEEGSRSNLAQSAQEGQG